MKMYDVPHTLNDYLDTNFECSCGRKHYAALKYVHVGKDAIYHLPRILKQLGKTNPYLISDPTTYRVAGQKCMDTLHAAGIRAVIHPIQNLEFDEATVGEVLIHKPDICDIVVAVGSGSVNDMARFLSFRLNLPFMTVATAASMDGFASSTAAIHVNHLKASYDAHTPLAIIGDTEILKEAPYTMIAAGLGDLLGKSTCLCDWKLAHLITGEHLCDGIAELMESCVADVLAVAPAAKERDSEAIGKIMEGLILSGIAMSLYENSRPASGCEHHMSHYWETIFGQKQQRAALHGTQVGIGTVMILRAVEQLLKTDVDFDAARKAAAAYNAADWESSISAAYGSSAPGVIEIEKKTQKNEPNGRLARIHVMEKNWDAIQELLKTLPSSSYVQELLEGLDSPSLPAQIGVDKALLKDTFLYCKEIRARYTILQMLWDLDLLDRISDAVIAEL